MKMPTKTTLITWLAAAVLGLLCGPALAVEKYTPAPLQVELLSERIDEHDQQICDLDERVRKLESNIAAAHAAKASDANETVVRIIIDGHPDDTAKALVADASTGPRVTQTVAGAGVPTKSRPVKTAAAVAKATPSAPVAFNTARRKTPGELQRDLRAKWTSRVYADISPRTSEWARHHLIQGGSDHRYTYTASQLVGLSTNELWMLHNLAHSSAAIPPTTTGNSSAVTDAITEPVDVFVPTPSNNPPTSPRTPTPIPRTNGCPGGRCPTAGSSRVSGWYPGKLLFGR